jgi:glycosyltransferase involved in cell wall biosynthesis
LVKELRRRVETRCEGAMDLVTDASADRLAALYDESDVFVMPSHHEGFCVPVIEAAIRGLPVVATSAGALPETVGVEASLLAPGDVGALARALRASVSGVQGGAVEVRGDLARFGRESFRSRFLAGFDEAVALRSRRDRRAPMESSEMWSS